jgi:hypothetical protein
MYTFDQLFNFLMEAHVGIRSSNPERDLEVGASAEEEFVRICGQHKLDCEKSKTWEDMADHFDYRVWKRNRDRAWAERPENARNQKMCNYVEVKGKKNIEGTDKILIELTNVNGDMGWLYGKANYIAYKNLDDIGFRMIPRYNLQKETEKLLNIIKVDSNTFVYRDTKEKVKVTKDKFQSTIKGEDGRCVLYNRAGNADLSIYVPSAFIDQMKAFDLLPKV